MIDKWLQFVALLANRRTVNSGMLASQRKAKMCKLKNNNNFTTHPALNKCKDLYVSLP